MRRTPGPPSLVRLASRAAGGRPGLSSRPGFANEGPALPKHPTLPASEDVTDRVMTPVHRSRPPLPLPRRAWGRRVTRVGAARIGTRVGWWAVALGVVVGGLACQHDPFVWVDNLPAANYQEQPYAIRPGDEVEVRVWNQDQLQTTARVRTDGRITIPLAGDVEIAGVTPPDAAKAVSKRLEGIVLDPRVSVIVRQGRPDFVTVLGEVRNSGRFPLEQGETILHQIAKAGGVTEYAANEGIFVIRRQPEPLRIRFSYSKLAHGVGRGLDFVLRDGDVIVVE